MTRITHNEVRYLFVFQMNGNEFMHVLVTMVEMFDQQSTIEQALEIAKDDLTRRQMRGVERIYGMPVLDMPRVDS